ncbi:MAG: hypothetical protein IKX88_08020, partial [Thermoguttaceae bacterium]|nr:hypothetical protein [Thermoguttaceae bacterium]
MKMKFHRSYLALAAVIVCGAVYGTYSSRSTAPSPALASAQTEEDAQEPAPAPEPQAAIVAVEKATSLTTLQPRQYAGRLVSIEEVN